MTKAVPILSSKLNFTEEELNIIVRLEIEKDKAKDAARAAIQEAFFGELFEDGRIILRLKGPSQI
jgi:hypothetical protein